MEKTECNPQLKISTACFVGQLYAKFPILSWLEWMNELVRKCTQWENPKTFEVIFMEINNSDEKFWKSRTVKSSKVKHCQSCHLNITRPLVTTYGCSKRSDPIPIKGSNTCRGKAKKVAMQAFLSNWFLRNSSCNVLAIVS